jgi:hypothetical protein
MLRSISTARRLLVQNRLTVRHLLVAVVLFAAAAGPARAADVSVVVVPPFDPQSYAGRGAVGLFVPGAGQTVTRRAAVASLVRGKVEPSVLGGTPSGKPLITLGRRPADVTVYVALPPTGEHGNTRRYPIAIVGGGYHGILTSRSTRIRGLVSIADIAPTARALADGTTPRIRSSPDTRAAAHLRRLDQRLTDTHDVRLWATLILVGTVLAGALLAFAFRSEYLGRAGVLAAPAVLAGSLFLAAVAVTEPWVVAVSLLGLTIGACFALAAVRGALPWALLALVVVYLAVFAVWPEVNSLAAIGARPDGGGRFYGAGNLTETVLLTVSLEAAALLGGWWIPVVFVLTLVTVGWSHAGADGGGIVVLMVAFGVLAARMYDVRFTVRRVVLGGLGVVAAVAAIVGLDAATGGSSHVTHAFRRGPVSLAEELAHRVHISAASVASGWNEALVFAVSIAALVVLWTRPPRFPAGDALLSGVAVSLLVNDSPVDVASAGALSYAVLWSYERVRQPARVVARPDSVGLDAPGVTPRA